MNYNKRKYKKIIIESYCDNNNEYLVDVKLINFFILHRICEQLSNITHHIQIYGSIDKSIQINWLEVSMLIKSIIKKKE